MPFAMGMLYFNFQIGYLNARESGLDAT